MVNANAGRMDRRWSLGPCGPVLAEGARLPTNFFASPLTKPVRGA
ncbi:hypothetical protein SJ05684_b41820 (plasmid) [Sinorhizobium sojae CCBAU 05684]|uniref:Uncharacterized protein n=1 Tax=Sinorhizobium sojae CCBAU 05684 TaxID=716928 RepID=A0A249PHJ9_9HYPH|nr:hypothetical protein SJ05684_b41820 [Sinorhizobium sojae CCBAU 05684]